MRRPYPLLVPLLLVSCTDQSIPADVAMGPSTLALASETAVFYVAPSGDRTGVTDWAAIMAAFDDARAAGQGSVVELGVGEFYIHKPIEVYDFSGGLRGQGMDATTLRMAPGVEFALAEDPYGYMEGYPWPAMLLMSRSPTSTQPRSEFAVSDLHVIADQLSIPYVDARWPELVLRSSDGITFLGSGTFERLWIEGIDDPRFPPLGGFERRGHFSLFVGIHGECAQSGPEPQGVTPQGRVTYQNIVVENATSGLVGAMECDEVVVGGAPGEGVRVTNSLFGIQMWPDGAIEVSHSEVTGRNTGVWLWPGQRLRVARSVRVTENVTNGVYVQCGPCPSETEVTHNEIQQILPPPPFRVLYSGVEIWGGGQLLTIQRNNIRGVTVVPPGQWIPGRECSPWGPAYIDGDVVGQASFVDNTMTAGQDACANFLAYGGGAGAFRSNRLLGQPIWAGVRLAGSHGWNIRDNNVNMLNACPDILLEGDTSHNTVVGNRFTTVWDDGENNTILGTHPNDCAKPKGTAREWSNFELTSAKAGEPSPRRWRW
jgi:hypothetical protein